MNPDLAPLQSPTLVLVWGDCVIGRIEATIRQMGGMAIYARLGSVIVQDIPTCATTSAKAAMLTGLMR